MPVFGLVGFESSFSLYPVINFRAVDFGGYIIQFALWSLMYNIQNL
jgi:hypothetical protein